MCTGELSLVRVYVQHLTACSTMRNTVLHNYTDVLLETRSMPYKWDYVKYVKELQGAKSKYQSTPE